MHHRGLALVLLATLDACQPNACAWEAERDAALCGVLAACFDGEPVPVCVADVAADPAAAPTCAPDCAADGTDGDGTCDPGTSPEVRCPAYDPGAGRRCVAALDRQAQVCPTSRDAWLLPGACGETCAL